MTARRLPCAAPGCTTPTPLRVNAHALVAKGWNPLDGNAPATAVVLDPGSPLCRKHAVVTLGTCTTQDGWNDRRAALAVENEWPATLIARHRRAAAAYRDAGARLSAHLAAEAVTA